MKKFNKRRRIFAAAVILSAVFLLSGCTPLFVRKDSLIERKNSAGKSGSTVQITEYTEVSGGTVLAHDAEANVSVFLLRTKTSDGKNEYSLNIYEDAKSRQLFTTEHQVTEAAVNKSAGFVYFKESNALTLKGALFVTDLNGSKKTRISEESLSQSLAWCMASDGSVYFVSGDNTLLRADGAQISNVANLPSQFHVKQISCLNGRNEILILDSQQAASLYRMDLNTYEIVSVDSSVVDFSVSRDGSCFIYTKASQSGSQIYRYDFKLELKTYIGTAGTDKISVSPDGKFIAYTTRITSAQPAQSVFVIEYGNNAPYQLTANTTLSGSIFWQDTHTILFSTMQLIRTETETETSYKTHRISFTLI